MAIVEGKDASIGNSSEIRATTIGKEEGGRASERVSLAHCTFLSNCLRVGTLRPKKCSGLGTFGTRQWLMMRCVCVCLCTRCNAEHTYFASSKRP